MQDDLRRQRFASIVMPHLDAAFRLARWLSGNTADAEDVVQEAVLRAFRYFDGWRGGDGRVWLLAIVRNTHRNWAQEQRRMPGPERPVRPDVLYDAPDLHASSPETTLILAQDRAELTRLVEQLSPDLREVIVLRDLQELSFRDVSEITGSPIATVQSRLERARAILRARWNAPS